MNAASVSSPDSSPSGVQAWPSRLVGLGEGAQASIASLGEAGILRLIAPHLRLADAELGPGDDAAVLTRRDARTVVTTDSMVSELDWRDDWSSPFDVGVKVVAQNLADLAAMGARFSGIVTALATDTNTRADWIVELTRGMSDELRRAGAGVGSFGGDLSGAPPKATVITLTALGYLEPGEEPFLRSRARAGEVLVVSDPVGRSQAGLLALLGKVAADARHEQIRRECVAVHRAPRPRYPVGQARAAGIRCAMDVSDGLSTDAGRLAEASQVVLDLDEHALRQMAGPLVDWLGEDLAMKCVLSSGEEHALLATCAPDKVPTGWLVIGEVAEPAVGAAAGVTMNGQQVWPQGWEHFTSL